MAVTEHPVVLFAEGFMVIGVNTSDVTYYGAEAVLEALQNHEWVRGHGLPVVIAYLGDEGEALTVYGAQEWIDTVSQLSPAALVWTHTLALEWPDRPITGEAEADVREDLDLYNVG